MVSELMADFAIGGAVLGTLSALYFYPYVLLQIPLGALIDRFGARILLSSALLAAGTGSILFATAQTVEIAYLGRTLVGTGSAVGFLASLALAGKWFPPRRFAFLAGLVMFFGMGSGIIAQAPLAVFVDSFGWRSSMWSLGGFAVLLATLILLFVRNAPESLQEEKPVPHESWKQMWHGLGRAVKSLEVWKTALVASTMSGPMLAIGGLWGTPYLMSAFEISRPAAAGIVSLLLLGWAFGAPFNGWLSDHIGHRKLLLVCGSGVLSLAVGVLILFPPQSLWASAVLLVITGSSGAAMAITFALARENSPKDISGSVTGIVNSMTVASGAVLQPGVGLILDRVWDGTVVDGVRIYQASDYRVAFTLILATTVIGFLTTLTLKESSFGKN